MSGMAQLTEAVRAWAEHCVSRPDDLAAEILSLRRGTGAAELDVHNALLADVLQGVHTLVSEALP